MHVAQGDREIDQMLQRYGQRTPAFLDELGYLDSGLLAVHLTGGHSRGMQCVRVETAHGPMVLASDATHFHENFETGKLFPIVVDAEDMLNGFRRLKDLAGDPKRVIPGHDPLVRDYYPQAFADAGLDVRRLDVPRS